MHKPALFSPAKQSSSHSYAGLFSSFFIISAILLSILLSTGCKDDKKTKAEKDKAAHQGVHSSLIGLEVHLDEIISAHPADIVSAQATIDFEFKQAVVPEHLQGSVLSEGALSFEPAIKGQAVWISNSYLRFTPDENLPPGTQYQATLYGPAIFGELIQSDTTSRSFKVAEQEILSATGEFIMPGAGNSKGIAANAKEVQLQATLLFAQVVKQEQLKNDLTLIDKGRKLDFRLQEGKNKREIIVLSDPVKLPPKGNQGREIRLELDEDYTINKEDYKTAFYLAAPGEFKLLASVQDNNPQSSAMGWNFRFSENLKNNFDYSSYMQVTPAVKWSADAEGKYLRIRGDFIPGRAYQFSLAKEFSSAFGTKLGQELSKTIRFANEKPRFEWLSKGVFLPQKNDYKVQFKSINLKQIQVRVREVFSQNMLFFMQNNAFHGTDNSESRWNSRYQDLERVGKVVYEKKLELPSPLNSWHNTELDLSSILQSKKGSAWVVELSISTQDLSGICTNSLEELSEGQLFYEDDNWYQNPCRDGYYYQNGKRSQLLVSSSIGLISKTTADSIHIWATNVENAEPLSGLNLNAYSYANEKVASGTTNSQGYWAFAAQSTQKESPKAHAIYGEHPLGTALLKLNRPAWEMSRFEIGGASENTSGLQAFIYADRGVHRPGDTVWLSAVIRNGKELPPPAQPVQITVENSRGKEVLTLHKKAGQNGHIDFQLATGLNDPTGTWMLTLTLGETKFRHGLRIETVKPNRLKVHLEAPDTLRASKSGQLNLELNSKYLFGAPAAHLKAKIRAYFTEKPIAFSRWPEYRFSHPISSFRTQSKDLWMGKLNAQGNASIKAELPSYKSAGSQVLINLETTVNEKGGGFTKNQRQVLVSPYKTMVGLTVPDIYSAKIGKELKVPAIVLNEKGNAKSGRPLRVRVYNNMRYWWWHYDRRSHRDFRSDENTILAHEEIIYSGTKPITLSYKPEDYGRHLFEVVDMESGHASAFYFYASRWGQNAASGDGDKMHLDVKTNAKVYNPGDTLIVSFASPENGLALVSLESGNRLLQQKWVKTTAENTTAQFIVDESMLPNCYVVVGLMQPHGQNKNDQAFRLYGVAPISVEDARTRLDIDLKMPEEIKPGEEFTAIIQSNSKQDASFTLAVVDEGLLDLTAFKTPAIWDYFFRKLRLSVRTNDNMEDIIGALLPDMDSRFSIGGGGGEARRRGDNQSRRFKAVSLFSGVQTLKAGQKKEIRMMMPNYMGSVRAMLVASAANSYASRESTIAVKKPLIILPTLPRVARPGDEFELPISLFALHPDIKAAKLTLSAEGPVEIIGAGKQTLNFSNGAEQDHSFTIKVKAAIGTAKFHIKAQSGKFNTEVKVELPINTANPYITLKRDTILKAGEELNWPIEMMGVEGTNHARIRLSRMPDLGLEERMNDLIRYPYGCVEQTTSSVFPQLYLNQLVSLSEAQKQRVANNIKQGIKRLHSFQTADGGFSYWPGQSHSNNWGSNYAGHFLLLAKQAGYKVPQKMLNRWINYQKQQARRTNGKNHRYQTYRLFLLALAGEAQTGPMNLLRENHLGQLDPLSQSLLAAAYKLSGKNKAAQHVRDHAPITLNPYREMSGTYGSSFRDMALRAWLTGINYQGEPSQQLQMMQSITETTRQRRWYSTQEMAFMLLAFADFYQTQNAAGTPDVSDVKAKVKSASFSDNIVVEGKYWQKDLSESFGSETYIKNTGKRPLFVTLVREGIPIEMDIATENKGIILTRNFYDLDGKPISLSDIKQSEAFWVHYQVRQSTGAKLKEVALSSLFPAGWEIENPRMQANRPSWVNHWPNQSATYVDVRDDRVNWFFDLPNYRERNFLVKVHPSFAGDYVLPPVLAETMYDPDYYARIKGMRVEVK